VDKAEVLRLRRLGLSPMQIAQRVGCTEDNARVILRKLGMTGGPGRPRQEEKREQVKRLLLDGVDPKEIAAAGIYERSYTYVVIRQIRATGELPVSPPPS
jgi:hypothetical protein